eukprot:scaffold70659_cov24-Tisochrysis_lutea.AAC.1
MGLFADGHDATLLLICIWTYLLVDTMPHSAHLLMGMMPHSPPGNHMHPASTEGHDAVITRTHFEIRKPRKPANY